MAIIRIDHDIPFSEYDEGYLLKWLEKLPKKYIIQAVYIRESCGCNTHAKVEIEGYVHPLEEMMIRAVLHDDCRRIRGDLERLMLDSPIFSLLFDIRHDTEKNITLKAGKWVRIK